jgi:hypothetical protein
MTGDQAIDGDLPVHRQRGDGRREQDRIRVGDRRTAVNGHGERAGRGHPAVAHGDGDAGQKCGVLCLPTRGDWDCPLASPRPGQP